MTRRIAAVALALGIAGAGAGCGSTSHTAVTPKSRSAPETTTVSATLKRDQAELHRRVLAALHAPDHQHYGGIPAALRSHQGDPDRVLDATPGHPVTTDAGSAVRLELPGGAALADVIGPYIPQRVMGTDASAAFARFELTFTHVRGNVPLPVAGFGIVDQSQTFHRPKVTVTRHRDTARVTLRAYLPQGGGRLIYAPRRRPLITWEFSQETD